MPDPRISRLAQLLIDYSVSLQPGEKVLIEAFDVPDEFVCALVERAVAAGGVPFVELRSNAVQRSIYRNATEEQMSATARYELTRMTEMDAYIGIRGGHNSFELSDVPSERMALYQRLCWKPVSERRTNHTKWAVLRYPSPAFAQAAGMSTEAFTDFFFDVCTLDYAKMAAAQEPLKARMEAADRVEILGPGTELSFSIKGIGARICAGLRNIPDGECFTCPTRSSAEGVIQFNAPTIYQGRPFDDIRLVLKEGHVVEATGSDTTALNAILDSDEGARYIGEFSLGFNPYILKPMRDVLFDEKINGSLHFTPGNAYQSPGNGNVSQVHWDMVLIQRPEWGGGEVRFDGELIRKDGRFVPDDLQGLNPEQLM